MTPEERHEAVLAAMLMHVEPNSDGWVHVHQNDVWNAVATAHDAAILAERERAAGLDFTMLIWNAAKRTGISKRLALYNIHEMSKDIKTAIRKDQPDGTD